MAQLKQYLLLGFFILTVSFLQEAAAANCADDSSCENDGTCPDNSAPCVCVNGFTGDTCATPPVCSTNDDCKNDGTCDTTAYTCTCGDYKGDTCENACDATGGCQNEGKCKMDATPYTCDCAEGYEGAMCATKKENAASTLQLSLMAAVAVVAALVL